VGFNMSWIFVDQIDLNDLYAALDVKSTGEAADPYDLGTKRVPLAGLRPKDGWCAQAAVSVQTHCSRYVDSSAGRCGAKTSCLAHPLTQP